MPDNIEQILEQLEASGQSAALTVADHLRTVASNGPEYATAEALREEARQLIEHATAFLTATK